jgi:hypothetical protein
VHVDATTGEAGGGGTYTAATRAQHYALYHAWPEQRRELGTQQQQQWWTNVDAVKRQLPRRMKLRYGCDAKLFASPSWWAGPLKLDAQSLDFMQQQPHSRLWSWARSVLKVFVTDTSALGILGAYPMHVLSTQHCRELLGQPEGSPPLHSLLDVGAGVGSVTGCMAPLFSSVDCTEVSRPMLWRLRHHGYTAHATPSPATLAPQVFSVVSMLNVLDRCDRPISMLKDCHSRLEPGGLLLLAVVIPCVSCLAVPIMAIGADG